MRNGLSKMTKDKSRSSDDEWLVDLARQDGWSFDDINWEIFDAIIDSETDRYKLLLFHEKLLRLSTRLASRVRELTNE